LAPNVVVRGLELLVLVMTPSAAGLARFVPGSESMVAWRFEIADATAAAAVKAR
jgi:hypothetical protein